MLLGAQLLLAHMVVLSCPPERDAPSGRVSLARGTRVDFSLLSLSAVLLAAVDSLHSHHRDPDLGNHSGLLQTQCIMLPVKALALLISAEMARSGLPFGMNPPLDTLAAFA